jgi:predicted N-acetyltransferase YhbS
VAFFETLFTGFVTISMADVRTQQMEINDNPSIKIENLPALQIGQLAVTTKRQGQDIGTKLVSWCMNKAIEYSKSIGCRSLVLNAIPQSVDFYKKIGFIELRQKDRKCKTMYLVIPKKFIQ